jgi:hypothetical protein
VGGAVGGAEGGAVAGAVGGRETTTEASTDEVLTESGLDAGFAATTKPEDVFEPAAILLPNFAPRSWGVLGSTFGIIENEAYPAHIAIGISMRYGLGEHLISYFFFFFLLFFLLGLCWYGLYIKVHQLPWCTRGRTLF